MGTLCLKCTIPPGKSALFPFLLGWRFPNRTPDWCGWSAPPGEGKTVIGNFYSARFKSAWDAVRYTVGHLEDLEARTRMFSNALRESTLPGRGEGGGERESFHPGHNHLLPHRRWRVSWL